MILIAIPNIQRPKVDPSNPNIAYWKIKTKKHKTKPVMKTKKYKLN